jgi:uncharacterized protein (TIGR02268 family)
MHDSKKAVPRRGLSQNNLAALAHLLPLLLLVAGAAEAAKPRRSAPKEVSRELQRRTVRITDASIESVSEVRVAAGTPTTILFELPVRTDGVLLADFKGWFFPAQVNARSLVLVPKADLPEGEVVTLTLTLDDGTVLPFKLVSHPRLADLQVDVLLALEERAAPESRQVLKATIAQLQAQLDEARALEGRGGVRKVAALLMSQDPDRPQAFQVDRRSLRLRDKQSRMLVEVRAAYRLFNLVYLVLQVENRDAAKAWVLDRAELVPLAAPSDAPSLVVQTRTELPTLGPETLERVVVVFEPPPHTKAQDYRLTLHERTGKRTVRLDGLRL